MTEMRVVFFPERTIEEAASRYRVYYLAEKLRRYVNVDIIESPFAHSLRYSSYGFIRKAYLNLVNNIKCLHRIIFTTHNDVLIFQRGEWQIGKPAQIKLFKKLINKNIVFDIDDAVFLRDRNVDSILSTVDVVFVGSHYLKKYAEKFNDRVYLIPTCVDTTKYAVKTHTDKDEIVIGWIGSPSTAKYLTLLKEPLEVLGENYKIKFVIIGCKHRILNLSNVTVITKKWSLQTEWIDLMEFDIGVMPLFDGPWERGKCAFKAIQYMTLGIPAVCSAIGEANYVIKHGENGYLCENSDDWIKYIEKLIISYRLRNKIGLKGRMTVEEKYDLSKLAEKVYEILKSEFEK